MSAAAEQTSILYSSWSFLDVKQPVLQFWTHHSMCMQAPLQQQAVLELKTGRHSMCGTPAPPPSPPGAVNVLKQSKEE